MSTYCRGSAAFAFGFRGAISSNRVFTPSGVGMVLTGRRISFSGSFCRMGSHPTFPSSGTRNCLPAHKIKIQVFVNGREIIDVARDEVSTDSPRRQRD